MDFSTFLPYILPYVKGCPDQLATEHVVRAAREFCARTMVWQIECDPIKAEAGAMNYTLQLAADQELVHVFALSVGGHAYDVPHGSMGRATARLPRYSYCDRQATFVGNGKDFRLNPPSEIEGELIVADVAVKPTLDATEWPDDLAEYVTDISHGAIATLCLMPRQDWHDLGTAQVFGALFKDSVTTTDFRVQGGFAQNFARGPSRWI